MGRHRDTSPPARAAADFEARNPGWVCEYRDGMFVAARVGRPLSAADPRRLEQVVREITRQTDQAQTAMLAHGCRDVLARREARAPETAPA